MSKRRPPVILELGPDMLPNAPSPADAPPIGDADAPATGERALALARRRGGLSGLARLFWIALVGLITLMLALWIESFVRGLFAREDWLGWLGAGLLGLASAALAGMALRELASLTRLERIERFRHESRRALEADDTAAAASVLEGLQRLYAKRPELEAAAMRMKEAAAETPGAAERLEVAEWTWMKPLDAAAERVIARTARDVAGATAMIPIPVVDVLAVLLLNLRMIRRIAEVYEGRAGWLGSWRLLRAVATHLAATGAVAATDDILGPLVGGGVLARLSRRFGEATVNAALSVRVGIAAVEVCRPLPFRALSAPRSRSVLLRGLRDWQEKAET